MQKKTYYNKQVEFFVVILLTILAFFLRFYNYMNVSVVLDETGFSRYAYSILADSWGWPLEQMATNHPPLIPYQLAVLTYLFGGSLEIFRVLIIFYGSFTVIVVYYLSKELYDQRVGILSALLLTFYSYHIIYSKYVMLEVPLIFLFFSLSVFSFWKSYNKPTDIKSAMISGVFSWFSY